MRICIGGGAGFIGSHIAKRLKAEGHHVVVADWERNIYFEESEYCSEFHLVDLRSLDNCIKVRVSLSLRLAANHLRQVTKDCEWVFNMAADMGGMGFIHSNAAVLLYNNTMISFNMVEVRSPSLRSSCSPESAQAARRNAVKRFFYASSACVYPEFKQTNTRALLPHRWRVTYVW